MKRILLALQILIAFALLLTSPGLPGLKAVLTGAPVRGSGLQQCSFSLAPESLIFPGQGGNGSFVVAATGSSYGGECQFQATRLTDWLTVSGKHPSPIGDGTVVDFSVTANNTGLARLGYIDIIGPDGAGSLFIVRQSVPGCVTSISPQEKAVNRDSTVVSIAVTAPADCHWRAQTDASWLRALGIPEGSGNGGVGFTVEENGGFFRTGFIDIDGQVFKVHQDTPDCPFGLLCGVPGFSKLCAGNSDVLTLSRRYRDDVLAGTARGRRYTQLYYQFSSEAVHVMAFNPLLILRAGEIVQRYKPLLQSMARGETVTLTTGDLDEMDGFLDSFAARGSAELRNAVQGLRQDIRDPHVHSDLRISVIDGPRREMPVPDQKQSGIPWPLFGAFGTFGLHRRRRRALRKQARRLLVLVLGLSGIAGWSASGPLSAPWRAHAKANPQRAGTASPVPGRDRETAAAQTSVTPRKLPLSFVPNFGGTERPQSFLSRTRGASTLVTPTRVAITLTASSKAEDEAIHPQPPISGVRSIARGAWASAPPVVSTMGVELAGANSHAQIEGIDRLSGVQGYFTGSDPTKWRAEMPCYARVRCKQVYPGIDMIYYGNHGQLEYDFIVAPRTDPRVIRLGFFGVDRIRADTAGGLVLLVPGGEIRQRAPAIYQESGGSRHPVTGRCVIHPGIAPGSRARGSSPAVEEAQRGPVLVEFEVGAYDGSQPLIIDPVLSYSTYLGGSGIEEGTSIAVDSAGNTYVAGLTLSTNFPTLGVSQPSLAGGDEDAFVAKLDASGRLVYSTYLGGDGQDNASGIAVDSAGNAYVVGFTGSTNFPTKNALQPSIKGRFNAFIAKLSPSGSLLYSTYLGGSREDGATGIAVDSRGEASIVGITSSPDFPTVAALQTAYGGDTDAFVAKLDQTGSKLVYSTYLGGSGVEMATGIALDSAANVYITGATSSQDFHTASPFQAKHAGGLFDGFVAKLDPSGATLVYSTYLGGSGEDRPFRIAVDSAGAAYLTGDTDSANFPTANAIQTAGGGISDAFVAKLNPSGSELVYSTYLGGSGIDGGTAIAVDSAGHAYVAGFTNSTNFPTANPMQPAYGGGPYDAFVARLSPSGASLDYSTYLGGSGVDAGFGIAVDADGNANVIGLTSSTNFPLTSATQTVYGGGESDIFIARIKPGPIIAAVSIDGKNLIVSGSGFDAGATLLIGGQPQRTANDSQNPATTLIGKKVAKRIAPGQAVVLRVQDADGTLSNEFNFQRPATDSAGQYLAR